jgi:hypothetical protein
MARYGLPILTIVWNNLNYQTVRTNFHTFGGEMAKQKKYPEVYLGDPEIDFVMLARAQGIDGMHVREPEALGAALKRGADAIAAGEPFVLDVRVAPVGTGADSTWHQRFKLRREGRKAPGPAGPARPLRRASGTGTDAAGPRMSIPAPPERRSHVAAIRRDGRVTTPNRAPASRRKRCDSCS